MREELRVFAEEMEKVLDEKFEKYQDGWKDESLDLLKEHLIDQTKQLILYESDDPNYNKRMRRTILHAGNYLMFLFSRLNK